MIAAVWGYNTVKMVTANALGKMFDRPGFGYLTLSLCGFFFVCLVCVCSLCMCLGVLSFVCLGFFLLTHYVLRWVF